jgi:hypothetical protein
MFLIALIPVHEAPVACRVPDDRHRFADDDTGSPWTDAKKFTFVRRPALVHHRSAKSSQIAGFSGLRRGGSGNRESRRAAPARRRP